MKNEEQKINPLGVLPVSKLMVKFAVPSIIAMLVGALYNIVDQLFIGNAVGILGNGATNIAFPFSTSCIAISLLFGIGGASCFNLSMGAGDKKKAPFFIGNAAAMLSLLGIILSVITLIFLNPMLRFFGATEDILPYAVDYVSITALGFPFLILTTGGGHLIRADGSPQMTMICNISGAVINTVLDALFVLGFGWGMKGAAFATIIGQIISALIVIVYMTRFKTVPLRFEHFIINVKYTLKIASIGMASFVNQIAIMVVQIVINQSLRFYGALSEFGPDIPIACAGIIMKVNQIMFSVVIGIGQGTQPIESFNYGAKQYDRVRDAYKIAIKAGILISIVSFIMFQLFPDKILGLFGNEGEQYIKFGTRFFRIFLFFTWLNALQPITSTFFTSIGKPIKGVFLSLTRNILFFLPIMLILPLFMGINGIIFTGPVSDLMSAIVAVGMAAWEFRIIKKLEIEKGVN